MKKYYPLLSIILINLIPIIGVLWLGWNIYQLIIIFWLESFMAGIFNIAKMLFARKKIIENNLASKASKGFLMIFFAFHYYIFIFVLGLLTMSFVVDVHKLDITNFNFRIIFVILFISYVSNFIGSYIMNGKYLATSAGDLFFAPYGRVFILAFLMFSGAFIVKSKIHQEDYYLFIIVGAKLLMDLVVYALSNRRFSDKNETNEIKA